MTELDWGALQKEAASAGVLPEGEYSIIVTEATAVTSANGKPMIKTKFRVTDGPHKNKPIWNQFVISAESAIALRIFFNHMAAFGLDTAFFAGGPSMDAVAKNLLNRGATVKLGVRQWQGSDRNEVNGVSPLQTGGPIPPGMVTGAPSAGPSPTSSTSLMTTPSPVAAATPTTPAAPPPTTPPVPPTTPF